MWLYLSLLIPAVVISTLITLSVLGLYMRKFKRMFDGEYMHRQETRRKLDEFLHKFDDYDVEVQ